MGASSVQMPDPPLAQPALVTLQGMEAKPSTVLSLSMASLLLSLHCKPTITPGN